jgi:hypothetical protein
MKIPYKPNSQRSRTRITSKPRPTTLKNTPTSDAAQAYMFLGGAMAIDKLQNHLASQVIGAMMTVEEQKLYLEYGYDTFADFLNEVRHFTGLKNTVLQASRALSHRRPDNYDLFTNWKLPLTTRRLLAEKGVGIELEGDEVVIGGQERINVGETKAIKEIIARLVKDTIEVQEQKAKTEGKVEKLQTQIKQGQSEYELLQRKYDDATQMRPFDRSLMMSVHWQLSLLENVSQLPDAEQQKRGYDDLKLLAGLFFRLRDAYHIDMALADFNLRVNDTDLDKKINDILADGDLSEGEE